MRLRVRFEPVLDGETRDFAGEDVLRDGVTVEVVGNDGLGMAGHTMRYMELAFYTTYLEPVCREGVSEQLGTIRC